MTERRYYTATQLAEIRQDALGSRTASGAYHKLVRMRREGNGPPYVKGDSRSTIPVYDINEFDEWMESRKVRSVAEWRERVIGQK